VIFAKIDVAGSKDSEMYSICNDWCSWVQVIKFYDMIVVHVKFAMIGAPNFVA